MSFSVFDNSVTSGDHHLVSVIIPIYNVEHYIVEAIQSVKNQTLEAIQLILVDDGSTDQSAAIVEKYVQHDPAIIFIRQENKGVSVARNRGLKEAKGTYVFFMDSDDTIAPDFIASSYAIAKAADADIVLLGENYILDYPHTPAAPTCAQFLRRSLLEKYPEVRFPEGIQPCEDGLLSHQLLALTTKVVTHAKAQYFYRKHDQQNHVRIDQDSWKVLHQIPAWLRILNEFYTKHNLWTSHGLHLLRFLEHEPFEIRYLRLSLDEEQRVFLFALIRNFVQEHQLLASPYENRIQELHPIFRNFLESDSHRHFESKYRRYQRWRTKQSSLLLFLVKLIPLTGQRRHLRKRIRKFYHI